MGNASHKKGTDSTDIQYKFLLRKAKFHVFPCFLTSQILIAGYILVADVTSIMCSKSWT